MNEKFPQNYTEAVKVPCPCGGVVSVGQTGAEAVPTALHSLPYCSRFELMEFLDFITYLRTEQEKKVQNG